MQPFGTYLLEIDQGGQGGGRYSKGPVEIDAAVNSSSKTSDSSSSSAPTSSLASASTSAHTPLTSNGSKPITHGISRGAIAGIFIAVITIALIAIGVFFLFWRRRGRKSRTAAAPAFSGYEKPELEGLAASERNNNVAPEVYKGPWRGTNAEDNMMEA